MSDEAKAPPLGAGECNSETGSKLLMMTPQWFNRLVRDGWIKKVGKNRYRIVDVVQGYIKYLQDENRRAQKSASASRVQDARAAEIEFRNARESGKVVDIEDALAWQSDILGTLRTELIGVPAASTRDLELRAVIEKQLNAALDRSRSSLEETGRVLRSGIPVALAGEEADA